MYSGWRASFALKAFMSNGLKPWLSSITPSRTYVMFIPDHKEMLDHYLQEQPKNIACTRRASKILPN